MKICYKCSEAKELSEFHKNKNKADGLQNYCKACAKTRNSEYYQATPERNDQRRAHQQKAKLTAREYIIEYLGDHPCVDCGERDIVVLEFDHVRGVKKHAVSVMVGRGHGLESIKAEIDKCEVRCANCHRRVTAQRAGWYRI